MLNAYNFHDECITEFCAECITKFCAECKVLGNGLSHSDNGCLALKHFCVSFSILKYPYLSRMLIKFLLSINFVNLTKKNLHWKLLSLRFKLLIKNTIMIYQVIKHEDNQIYHTEYNNMQQHKQCKYAKWIKLVLWFVQTSSTMI